MTSKWTVLVIDDEPRARSLLRKMMKSSADFEIVGECSNGYEAVESVKMLRPDLMLLDVQMPEVDGFGVIEMLRGEELPQIVFVTAYDEYAMKAFEARALDYLLKPFDQDQLDDTLRRAAFQLKGRDLSKQTSSIIALLRDLNPNKKYIERFLVKLAGRVLVVPTDEVLLIEAEDKYVRLRTRATSYLVRDTISRVEEGLDPEVFVRVHRSAIVQLSCVKEIRKDFHGDFMLLLTIGQQVSLGRNYRQKFFDLIQGQPA